MGADMYMYMYVLTSAAMSCTCFLFISSNSLCRDSTVHWTAAISTTYTDVEGKNENKENKENRKKIQIDKRIRIKKKSKRV